MFINEIELEDFGCFHGQKIEFKDLNIIYGRNFSGKTTLSRLVDWLGTGEMPSKIENPRFCIRTDAGEFRESNPSPMAEVAVYNREFVKKHLSFLVNEDEGSIDPVALLGGDNTEAIKKIERLKQELGSDEEGKETHLFKDFQAAKKAQEAATAGHTKAISHLDTSNTNKARTIKTDGSLERPTYNKNHLQDDIEKCLKENLQKEEEETLRQVLKEEELSSLTLSPLSLKATDLKSRAVAIMAEAVLPSEAIQRFEEDQEVGKWAKEGVKLHEGKYDTCSFCGGPLDQSVYDRINAHFTEASDELSRKLQALKGECAQEIVAIDNCWTLDYREFQLGFQKKAEELKDQWNQKIKAYKAFLKAIKEELDKKERQLSVALQLDLKGHSIPDLQVLWGQLDALVQAHNQARGTLADRKATARQALIFNHVLSYIEQSHYVETKADIEQLKSEAEQKEAEFKAVESEVKKLQAEIKDLGDTLGDETRGAKLVTKYLQSHFGHKGLKLNCESSEEKQFTFRILRGDQPAFDLSEGERNLIAFSYFLAKLGESDRAKLVFIDDPMSSLDSNHLFFIFSLIQSQVARVIKIDEENKTEYRQLIISTHSLEFLKLLKRLDSPGSNKTVRYMFLSDKDGSGIRKMPNYMEKYVTEFNYLFSEICVCSIDENMHDQHRSFYSFGNNLRKFMETYLFFRFPEVDKHDEKLKDFFVDMPDLANRLINEFSHLEEIPSRAHSAMDYAEIPKLAKYVLQRIRAHDAEQYQALLASVAVADPLA